MTNYMIGYDLLDPGQDYQDLFDAIEEIDSTCWHCLDSTWIVQSELSATEIRDALKVHLDDNDRLLVTAIKRPAAWTGFKGDCAKWLKNNL
jgi:hypothetical protein